MIDKVISGGQTGIESIGLLVAQKLEIPTGGIAPEGWWTEEGVDKSLKDKYGLIEGLHTKFLESNNVTESDGTVIFGQEESPEVVKALNLLKRYHKPYVINPTIEGLVSFINTQSIKVLNVTGTVGSKLTDIDSRAAILVLYKALTEVREPKHTNC
jgi:hypothetical protein